jgi:LacI family transcriptional regulator
MPEDVSLSTVANLAGVSISTVSRIVNGETKRASAATVERVLAAIDASGYRTNPVGRALRRRQTQVVAVLAANLDNPVMATIAASTEAALREAGYVMTLCDTHDRPELQDEYLDAMRAQMVRGYVLIAAVPSSGLAELTATDTPIVFVNRRNPHGSGLFVGIDDRAAGIACADRLIAQGCRRLAVIAPKYRSSASTDRVAGFLERLGEQGLPPENIRFTEGEGRSHLDVGYDAAARILSDGFRPDAILCVSDQIAYGAHRRALEFGVPVPEDCTLMSIDGSPLNAWVAPWLTSIVIPYRRYGAEIVAGLTSIWEGTPATEHLLPFEAD